MTTEVEDIRREISKLSRWKNSRRYPQGLRARVTAFARGRLAAGASAAMVCRELGMGSPTLHRFLGTARPSEAQRAGFAPVRVVPSGQPPSSGGGFRLRGPHGLSVEGLSVEALAELIRRLGCLG